MNTHGFGNDSGRRPAWVEFAGASSGRFADDPLPIRSEQAAMTKRPLWHKDNVGFWLSVCVVISVVFSLIYRAIH